MLRRFLMVLMVVGLNIWAVGCSDNPTQTTGDTANLTEEFGGYTATDEAPAFGDPDLLAGEGEEEIDDPILASPAALEVVNDINSGVFHFRAVWGAIPCDSTMIDPTDWTGSLTLSRGALVVRRLIRFELNQDFYLPRTSRELVEWQSVTTIHNDGMALDIFVPPAPLVVDTGMVIDGTDTTYTYDTIPPEPVTLTFETGPYTRTFTLDELAALDELVELEDGNSVAFHGIQVFRDACRRGMMAGHWGFDDEGNGVFEGMWFSGFGRLVGFIKGSYGVDDNGDKVFFGKWITVSGEFEGLVKGLYGHPAIDNGTSENGQRVCGWYEGGIFDADGNRIGALAGRYHSAPVLEGGWFQGRWKLNCFGTNNDDGGETTGRDDGIGNGLEL